jgi:hypothetical protein
MEQKIPATFPGHRKVLIDRLAGLLGDLEPDRKTGLVLPHGRTVQSIAMWCDVFDLETHDVAATQFAIDREIEERQIPSWPCKLQPGSNGPDLLRLQRGLGPISLPLFQGLHRAVTALISLVLAALPRRPSFRIGPGRAQGAF